MLEVRRTQRTVAANVENLLIVKNVTQSVKANAKMNMYVIIHVQKVVSMGNTTNLRIVELILGGEEIEPPEVKLDSIRVVDLRPEVDFHVRNVVVIRIDHLQLLQLKILGLRMQQGRSSVLIVVAKDTIASSVPIIRLHHSHLSAE